jgi:hypothetical protein
MATSDKQVISVLLSDPEANLRSVVFASREGLVTVHPIDDAFPQQAAKIVIDSASVLPGDYVVRSVLAGSRRKLEILTTDETGLGFRRLLETLAPSQRTFATLKVIECIDGHTLIDLPEAITVATFKGR